MNASAEESPCTLLSCKTLNRVNEQIISGLKKQLEKANIATAEERGLRVSATMEYRNEMNARNAESDQIVAQLQTEVAELRESILRFRALRSRVRTVVDQQRPQRSSRRKNPY